MTTIRERVIELARERGTGVTVDTLIDVLDAEREDDEADLDAMTVDELHALAKERGSDLPSAGSGVNGAVLKADLIAALRS